MRSLQIVKLAAIAVALLTQFNANAESIRAKIKEFSSGPDIYICNAGVASAVGRPLCYFHGKAIPGNECTPTSCSTAKEICNTDCICTNPTGSLYVNSLMLSTQPYTDTDETGVTATPYPDLIAYSSAFTQFNSNQVAVWNTRLTDIGTKFTSEIYNASVFIDICYRGTQLPNYNGQVQITTGVSAIPFLYPNPTGTYPMDNDRTGLLMGQGHYLDLSAETIQSFAVCGDTIANTQFTLDSNGVPTGGPNYRASTAQPITQSEMTTTLGNPIVGPHFCKVRYVLREMDYASVLPHHRVNRSEGAEICTLTDITDPAAKPNSNRPLN